MDEIAAVIREGMPDRGMPAFGESLSEEEIRGLVIFIQEKEAGANPIAGPTPVGDEVFESKKESFRLETIVDDLELPWSLKKLPDGQWLVSERGVRLLLIDPTSGERVAVEGIPEVYANGQGGLLDIGIPPNFEKTGWVYLSFSDPGSDGESSLTAIVRGRIQGGQWTGEEVVFRADEEFYRRGRVHFGCRLVFVGDYLYFSIGDRGAMDQAQDLSRPNGKIHRIFADGTIPPDNPFVDEPGAFPTIWTYGNRNPQGLAYDEVTGLLWETEHGPRGGDELNLIEKGLNYGWPLVTYGMNYNGTPMVARTSMPGMVDPVTYWTPSLAVCGLVMYRGEAFPNWNGSLLSGSLAKQQLRRLEMKDDELIEQELIVDHLGRLRDVFVDEDGIVYLLTNGPGRIVRMSPAE